jgi:bacterioferritin-associated ferredoxin
VIICACNRLSEEVVRDHCRKVGGAASVKNIYPALGCTPCCGLCARTFREIVRETNRARDCDRDTNEDLLEAA